MNYSMIEFLNSLNTAIGISKSQLVKRHQMNEDQINRYLQLIKEFKIKIHSFKEEGVSIFFFKYGFDWTTLQL